MNIINLGILAHIDAGKTSVTENLLFACGATEKRGSVDKGDTITDSMDTLIPQHYYKIFFLST